VFVGRPSILGNPYRLGVGESRGATIDRYRRYLWTQLQRDTPQRREIARLAEMEDGVLVCFCAPLPCHANVIAAAIEWWRGRAE
jgi:hypothetical protein